MDSNDAYGVGLGLSTKSAKIESQKEAHGVGSVDLEHELPSRTKT